MKKNQRFFEGWYYRLTLPGPDKVSFAFIYSIENPIYDGRRGGRLLRRFFRRRNRDRSTKVESSSNSTKSSLSELSLACHQIMGPNDEYLVEATKDHTKLWAWEHQQGVGCRFDEDDDDGASTIMDTAAMDPDEFMSLRVKSGFQFTPHRLQGKLRGHDGQCGIFNDDSIDDNIQSLSSARSNTPGTCEYDMHITPISGWGDDVQGQKSTAGWLANYGVFEPHWQVTQADGRASGFVTWKGKRYEFQNAPFYAEKNWGGSFPIKWFWCQCNSFTVINGQEIGYTAAADGMDHSTPTLSVTAGGGTRKLPLLRSKESLGMLSVHYNGIFYEATPWLGTMDWEISDWGYWKMTGECTGGAHKFHAELEAICDVPGVKLRAPTEKDGMVYFCRDSFLAEVTLKLWDLVWDKDQNDWIKGDLIVEATSSQAAVEIGGGPWWDTWKDKSIMKQPMKGLVRLPYRLANTKKLLSTMRGVSREKYNSSWSE
jgi:tocopherol cyclase